MSELYGKYVLPEVTLFLQSGARVSLNSANVTFNNSPTMSVLSILISWKTTSRFIQGAGKSFQFKLTLEKQIYVIL